jgi:type I restriction enzyme S subunit
MNTTGKWPVVCIKDVCESIVDCVNKTAPTVDYPTPYKMIRTTNVKDGWINLDEVRFVEAEVFARWNRRAIPRPGDVILTREAPLGEVGMLRGSDNVFLGQRLVLYRADPLKLDNRFLLYSFRFDYLQGQIKSLGSGATVEHMRVPDAEKLLLQLPPTPVQKRIGDILSAYDDLIENNNHRIKVLEKMAQIIYREWFVNFCFPGHKKVAMTDSEMGPVPEGWGIFKFADLLQSSIGGDWGTNVETAEETSPVSVIRGTDLDDVRTGNILRTPRRFITPASLGKRRLQGGDIVIENSVNAKTRCTGSSLLISSGMLRRLQGDCIAASFCRIFRLKNADLAPLIYLHLRHLHREGRMSFYQNVAANGIANFQTSRFVETERIVLPTDTAELQSLLSTLIPLTSSNPADRVYNLRQTRDLILPMLISGEIDVENIEAEAVAQGI